MAQRLEKSGLPFPSAQSYDLSAPCQRHLHLPFQAQPQFFEQPPAGQCSV